MEELTDNYLMKKVQAGDLNKMGLLYERYHRELFGYFFRCTSDRSKSEDLVHNVFVRLIRYRHTFKGHGEFSYWMFATARNVWFDEHRKKDPLKHQDSMNETDHSTLAVEAPDEMLHQRERKTILSEALQQLSAEKRDAIVLSRYQGLKYKEIAKMSNCSENAIKSRVQRGMLELRGIIEKIETV